MVNINLSSISIVVGASSIILYYGLRFLMHQIPRFSIPSHLLNHAVVSEREFIDPSLGKILLDHVKYIGEHEGFFTNVDADTKTAYKGAREHIGEAVPISSTGACDHSYLFPNHNKSLCILPQRVDVGRHFITYGGPDAIREKFDNMVARTSSFGKYFRFNTEDTDDLSKLIHQLFYSDKFQHVAKRICPIESQVLDPFQYTFIVQIPGQTVPLHLDAPYFWGANRINVPQWLLAAMTFSNLFQEKFIHQVQVVGYLHEWEAKTDPVSGDFVYYNDHDGRLSYLKSSSLSGNAIDGSKVVHAARIYERHATVPVMDKGKTTKLRYDSKSDEWTLFSNEETLAKYDSNDLRITIVYRARCFQSEDELLKYRDSSSYPQLSVEDILEVFLDDMEKKGLISKSKRSTISKFDLAYLIMDNYIKYPIPSVDEAVMPLNYCIFGKIMPALGPILSLVC